MHIDPEQFVTACDAALTAGRQQLPPPSNPAAASRQLTDSTLMMLGHAAETSASSATSAGEPIVDDSEPPMLGAAQVAEDMPLAVSALLGDSTPTADLDSVTATSDFLSDTLPQSFGLTDSAMPSSPFWDPSLSTDLGRAPSALSPPSDPLAIPPDESLAPTSLLPSALGPSIPSVDLFDPSFPSAVQSLAQSSDDESLFDSMDAGAATDFRPNAESTLSGKSRAAQQMSTHSTRPASDQRVISTAANRESNRASRTLTVDVRLPDLDRITTDIVAKAKNMVQAAAGSAAARVVDQRLSNLRTQNDALTTARSVIFGS